MRELASSLALLLLVGCAAGAPRPAPPPQPRLVAGSLGQVEDRLAAAMRAEGLAPRRVPGGLAADERGTAPLAWAACPRVIVRDEQSVELRQAWASPRARGAHVEVGLEPAEGAVRVTPSVAVAATYLDRYRNTPFEGPCRSTGRLEGSLLAAARG